MFDTLSLNQIFFFPGQEDIVKMAAFASRISKGKIEGEIRQRIRYSENRIYNLFCTERLQNTQAAVLQVTLQI